VTCDCNDTTRVQHQSAVINISTLRHGWLETEDITSCQTNKETEQNVCALFVYFLLLMSKF